MTEIVDKPRARRGRPVAKICDHCSTPFSVKASKASVSRFCSRLCTDASRRYLPEAAPRECPICHTIFTPIRKKAAAVYCSKECAWTAARAACPEDVRQEGYRKSGDTQRGRGEGRAYRKLNGRHEHRRVAEEKAGRPLQFEDVVHHIDGDIHNNDPSNLEIITRAEHMRKHGLGVPGEPPLWFIRKQQKK